MAAGPLIDGNRRLQTLDQIDIRPFELMEELPGVGREAFDILPLSFGIERVEGQRALARPAGTGNHDQAIAGQSKIEVLQVVRPRLRARGCNRPLPAGSLWDSRFIAFPSKA